MITPRTDDRTSPGRHSAGTLQPGTGAHDVPRSDAVEHLATAGCWRLIEAASIGRLAVEGVDGIPDVFPVNYIAHNGSIYIRSAPGSKLMAIAAHPVAAFEIDGEDDDCHWSVVLRGAARRLELDAEIRESGVHHLVSSSPTAKHNFVCVTPTMVSGRRFAIRSIEPDPGDPPPLKPPVSPLEPTRQYEDTAEWPRRGGGRAERPLPIAHIAPR